MAKIKAYIFKTPEARQYFCQNKDPRLEDFPCEEYVHNSFVRGFIDHNGKLVAGYMLYMGEPQKYFQALSTQQETRVRKNLNHTKGKVCELSSMWINKDVNLWRTVYIYLVFITDIFFRSKRYVLAGSFIEKVKKIHTQTLYKIAYEGHVSIDGDKRYAWIYYANKWTIPLTFPITFTRNLALRIYIIYIRRHLIKLNLIPRKRSS